MNELEGRIGIVTGASSGIGYAIANVLAESGAVVYAISRTGAVKEGLPPPQAASYTSKGT
ncbi:MAG: SDR family NAD(P)-dependent oxidoreductase [Enterocloster clostridioformis]